MGFCHVVKFLVVIVVTFVSFAGIPTHAAAQQGCKKVCVKTEKKCVQKEKKCIRTKQECAKTAKKCVATQTKCLARNAKTGQCTSSEEVCTQQQEYCAQYRQGCAQYEDVCIKNQDECVQYREDCPKAQKGKISCKACAAQRTQCHNQCDKLRDLIEQSRCVNKCNAAYQCIIGVDCQQ